MRGVFFAGAFVAALVPTAVAGQDSYLVEIVHGDGTAWTGSAHALKQGAATNAMELCLVRREYINQSAFPRTVLRLPATVKHMPDRLELSFNRGMEGPSMPIGGALLAKSESDLEPDMWIFGEWPNNYDDDGNKLPREKIVLPDQAAYIMLNERVNVKETVFPFAGKSNPDRIVYFKSDRDAEEDKESTYDISVYDNMTTEQARTFEKDKRYFDLYGPGIVSTVANTDKIPQIRATLDAIGEGARVLNSELGDCPAVDRDLLVAVPVGLELWYARRLQRSGLVVAAYPDVQPRDPAWSDPFLFSAPQLRPILRSRQIATAEKYRVLWVSLDQSLKRFASQRRRNFSATGGLLRLGGTPPFMYRAEISGRSLALCGADRWERIVVQAAANGFNSVTGEAVITINFSDGYFGRGSSMPGDARMLDHRLPDGDLGRLQEIYVGTASRNGTIDQNSKC